MKNSIKIIRISVFLVLSLMFIGAIIVKFVDDMKIRTILFVISIIVLTLIMIMGQKSANTALGLIILLAFGILAFGVLMLSNMKGLIGIKEVLYAFQGNNEFVSFYEDGIGAKGYDDIESLLADEIEHGQKTGSLNDNELQEIYRIQVGDNIFVYFRDGEEEITEYAFFKQDDLYYTFGVKSLLYDALGGSDSYTAEETIRKDITNTMWRGVDCDELEVPAWGVSTDERIYSMTINSEKVDEVILINEKNGKKYYFWITTNVGEIKSIDDVKAAEIVISGSALGDDEVCNEQTEKIL